MDAGLISAIVMLVAWAVGTVMWEPPGWFHGLLTLGVFLVIMRVVALGTRRDGGSGGDGGGGGARRSGGTAKSGPG
jgi:hypothetical protein